MVIKHQYVARQSQVCFSNVLHRTDVGLPLLLVMAPLETSVSPQCERRDRSSWRRKRKRQLQTKVYMKSSSISLTELYVGLAVSSSSSTCTFRKESYERAAFSALRASASSWSAFFCKKWGKQCVPVSESGGLKEEGYVYIYLRSGCSALNGVLALDSLDALCFVIDDALDFRLVETIYDCVFALLDMDYTAYDMT